MPHSPIAALGGSGGTGSVGGVAAMVTDGSGHRLGTDADGMIYQEIDALKRAVRGANPRLSDFEASCFDGRYVTGDITADYLTHLADHRDEERGNDDPDLVDAAREGVAG